MFNKHIHICLVLLLVSDAHIFPQTLPSQVLIFTNLIIVQFIHLKKFHCLKITSTLWIWNLCHLRDSKIYRHKLKLGLAWQKNYETCTPVICKRGNSFHFLFCTWFLVKSVFSWFKIEIWCYYYTLTWSFYCYFLFCKFNLICVCLEHRDKKGFTPLILAATAGHEKVVEILMNHAADMEAQSERTKDTPLSLACSGGRYEVSVINVTHIRHLI